ncbi:MAG: cytochrome C [Gemmatimonadales bacterium]
MKRLLRVVGVVLLVLVVGGGLFVASRQHLTFDAPFPDVAASTDSAVTARGHYIVRGLAPCASCHGDPAQRAAYEAGEDIPLIGGAVFDIPPGRFYTRNLTPDQETGLGNVSDQAIARALRYGVGHDGRALLPFMEMQGLSDDDLVAVVSYLRAQAPVRNEVPPHRYTLIGKIVRATVLANPVGPASTPPTHAPRGATVENGRYLAESVALCWACHTERSEFTGALTGPRYAGASKFTEANDPGHVWAPANITSDKETGRLGIWTEDQFVGRFRTGLVIPKSPMPWGAYSRLDEDDLRAIYRYLKTVPAVTNDPGPPVTEVGRP